MVLAINPAWHLPAPGLSCMYQSLNCTSQYLMTAHVGVPAWHILPTGCFAWWVCTPGTSRPPAASLGGCARLAHLAHWLLCLVGVHAWHSLPTGSCCVGVHVWHFWPTCACLLLYSEHRSSSPLVVIVLAWHLQRHQLDVL